MTAVIQEALLHELYLAFHFLFDVDALPVQHGLHTQVGKAENFIHINHHIHADLARFVRSGTESSGCRYKPVRRQIDGFAE